MEAKTKYKMKMNLMLMSGKYGGPIVIALLVIFLVTAYFDYVNISLYVLWTAFVIAGYLVLYSKNIRLAEYLDKKS